jgi:hypothetical protein
MMYHYCAARPALRLAKTRSCRTLARQILAPELLARVLRYLYLLRNVTA